MLGFGGPNRWSYRPEFEGSIAHLLRRELVIGAEARVKRGSLKNPALNLREQVAWDVFAAYFLNKNVSISVAYVDLGEIVGALTANRKPVAICRYKSGSEGARPGARSGTL